MHQLIEKLKKKYADELSTTSEPISIISGLTWNINHFTTVHTRKQGWLFSLLISFMVLQLFLGDELIDSSVLSTKMSEPREREWCIQCAVNELLEKWDHLIKEQDLKPQFFIWTGERKRL